MRTLGVALTVILYSAITLFAVVLLAVVQLRSSGGAEFDTWRLNYDANRKLAEDQDKALNAAQNQLKENKNSLLYVANCLRFFDDIGVPQAKLIDSETTQKIKEAKQAGTPLDKLDGDVRCLVQGFTSLKWDREFYEMRDKDYSQEIAEAKKSLASISEQYAELIKGHQDFTAFRSMELWYQKPFFTSPYDLLVLLLVMMMGAIGGVARLLRDYGSSVHTDPSPKDYVFIPLIGAVVAIGGFVLAKTGLLLLSSTKGETSLSPYMISLVGIVSGLLAKEVIDTIATRGRGILQRDGPSTAQNNVRTGADALPATPKEGSNG
jgi:hypothetical protein